MKKTEIIETIKEFVDLLPIYAKNKNCLPPTISMQQICAINLHKEIIMNIYYWKLAPESPDVVEWCSDMVEDEHFEYVYKKISDIWEKKARAEIKEVIKELESTPIEDCK